jgi:dTDP-glucose pyrophosphorylase
MYIDKLPTITYSISDLMLYADDQILIVTLEDDLQTMAYHLKLIARKCKMTISSTKTK